MGRRLSEKDMSAAKYEMEVFNSRLKRGEIDHADNIERIRTIVCGCGVEGCIFISLQRNLD